MSKNFHFCIYSDEVYSLNNSNIKDTFSRLASSVSVLRVLSAEAPPGIIAATISSLMSLSVAPKEEEVAFALKKNSYVGEKVSIGSKFSISVLNIAQMELATYYGSSNNALRKNEKKWENYWDDSEEFPYIKSSVIALHCELDKLIHRSHSVLYIARIIQFRSSNATSPLIYQDRSYGRFSQSL